MTASSAGRARERARGCQRRRDHEHIGADHPAVKAYHRLLVWDMMRAPRLTRWSERLLNPLIGKSVVVYLRKPAVADVAA